MFLVIPLVEFLHVLGVDIDVPHENPAAFLCHVSVSSVTRSGCLISLESGPHAWRPGETSDTNRGAILGDIPQIPGLFRAIFRLIEAHRNEIEAQPSLVRSQSFGLLASRCSPDLPTEWLGRRSPSLRGPLGDRYRAGAHLHQTPLGVAGG